VETGFARRATQSALKVGRLARTLIAGENDLISIKPGDPAGGIMRLGGMVDYPNTNIVERAYQLARSGDCAGILEIRKQLEAEGFSNVTAHLAAAPSLRKALTQLCLQAQGRFEGVQARRLRGLQTHERRRG
jgi:hypothetical protein